MRAASISLTRLVKMKLAYRPRTLKAPIAQGLARRAVAPAEARLAEIA
jgi:hypothetical protein